MVSRHALRIEWWNERLEQKSYPMRILPKVDFHNCRLQAHLIGAGSLSLLFFLQIYFLFKKNLQEKWISFDLGTPLCSWWPYIIDENWHVNGWISRCLLPGRHESTWDMFLLLSTPYVNNEENTKLERNWLPLHCNKEEKKDLEWTSGLPSSLSPSWPGFEFKTPPSLE